MLQTQDFYSEIEELTQILLKISEEKIGGWGLWMSVNEFKRLVEVPTVRPPEGNSPWGSRGYF